MLMLAPPAERNSVPQHRRGNREFKKPKLAKTKTVVSPPIFPVAHAKLVKVAESGKRK
jgi:hypothetical protein